MFDSFIINPAILEITIVLVVLVGIAIWQKLYQAAMIMGGVYVVYFIFTVFSSKGASQPEVQHVLNDSDQIINQESDQIDLTTQPELITSDIIKETQALRTNESLQRNQVETAQSSVEEEQIIYSEEYNEEKAIEDENIQEIGITVLSMDVGSGVINRRIENPDTIFTVDIERIYCLTGIQNQNDSTLVFHKWYQEGRLQSKIKLDLGRSYFWRTWSYITINDQKSGNWLVVVEDTSGVKYDSLSFQIVDSAVE
ncbi:MAG: DUF2914 domain-containing protein [Candidatus Marinimicrobia bacterium]|nr:DUF2914 domain-containing protein [Candidatus Neomarinimicrobiota bacterium]